MENLTQKIERARAYLADIRAGHVSFADEGAPFMTLAGHLGALLEVIDDNYLAEPLPEGEQARLRDELLAEVPASHRLPHPEPGDFAWAVATALVRIPATSPRPSGTGCGTPAVNPPTPRPAPPLPSWLGGSTLSLRTRPLPGSTSPSRQRPASGTSPVSCPAPRPPSERRPDVPPRWPAVRATRPGRQLRAPDAPAP